MSRARTLANLGSDGSSLAGLLGDSSIILPAGTTAQRPSSPVAGSIRFNSTEQRYEGYNGLQWSFLSDEPSINVEYLVVAGGGGGGARHGGGGGAGGYLTSTAQNLALGTTYAVTVGAGGTTATDTGQTQTGGDGGNSIFHNITSAGGGAGGGQGGRSGGSGGGSGSSGVAGGSGTLGQGSAGGNAYTTNPLYAGGGGGGATAAGANSSGNGGAGGAGATSTITGTSTTYAGGGGGGGYFRTAGAGGAGGGGAGSSSGNATAGTANTGGGGGGCGASGTSGAGGSGVVILKVSSSFAATFSAGVTQTSATVGSDTVYTITAAGASDTVTFGVA